MPRSSANKSRLSSSRFRELVEDATVDTYGESEQAVGWLTMIDDNVAFPFEAELLGVTIAVTCVDVDDSDELVAACRRGKHRQEIRLIDLSLPSPGSAGAEWLEAYRLWRKRQA